MLQSFNGLLLRFQTVSNLMAPGDAKEKLDIAIDQAAYAITRGRDAVQGRVPQWSRRTMFSAIRTVGEDLASDATKRSYCVQRASGRNTTKSASDSSDEVYRIAGQALRNAFKHARAQSIEVEIRYDERELRLRSVMTARESTRTLLVEMGARDIRLNSTGTRQLRW